MSARLSLVLKAAGEGGHFGGPFSTDNITPGAPIPLGACCVAWSSESATAPQAARGGASSDEGGVVPARGKAPRYHCWSMQDRYLAKMTPVFAAIDPL